MSEATLLWGVLFGAIGLGFLVYGKRQRAVVPLVSGLLLLTYPYFVSNAWALVAIGLALSAVPFLIRL